MNDDLHPIVEYALIMVLIIAVVVVILIVGGR